METTKEEMMRLLLELQDLQIRISNSLQKIALNINICVFGNGISFSCYVYLFSDISGTSESVYLYSCSSYEENRTHLNYFTKYVKKLAKYGNEKSESNQTPT